MTRTARVFQKAASHTALAFSVVAVALLAFAGICFAAGWGSAPAASPSTHSQAPTSSQWVQHHQAEVRDGSGAYGEAARQALPGAVQVSDRWHLWHGLGEAVRKEVAAHCACWARGTPLQEGKRAAATLERWQQVRELRARNVGLLECARRLNLSLNTVKRYDRAS